MAGEAIAEHSLSGMEMMMEGKANDLSQCCCKSLGSQALGIEDAVTLLMPHTHSTSLTCASFSFGIMVFIPYARIYRCGNT